MDHVVEKQYLQMIKKVEEEMPEFALKKHKLLLRTMKTLDLFNFMSEHQFSNATGEPKHFIPYISQSLFISTQRFSEHLLKIIIVKDRSFAQYSYNFFMYDSNQKYLDYFVHCCFPTLFNHFSSDEYSECAYKFIKKYSEVEKNPALEDGDEEEEEEEEEEEQFDTSSDFQSSEIFKEKSELTSDSLILTYILHNFLFRQSLLESFHKKIFQYIAHEELSFEKKFRFLIQSFTMNISYLDKHQLQILNDLIQLSIQNAISLFKKIFIRLIKIWRYTPQFCTNNILGEIPDDPAEYSKKSSEESENLENFISRYQYSSEKETTFETRDKIKEEFEILFSKIDPKQNSYLRQSKLSEVFSRGKDSLLISDYDAFLISWIIKQGNKRDIIKSSNLTRNHEKQERFASKESALRLFFVDIDLFSRYFRNGDDVVVDNKKKKPENVYQLSHAILEKQRKNMSAIRLIENQHEACKKSINSIVLKFSDASFLNDPKYGMNSLFEQLKIISMEIIPQINAKLEDEIIKQYLNSSNLKQDLETRFEQYFNIVNTEVKKIVKNFELMNENKYNFHLFFENMDLFVFGQYIISLNRNLKNSPKSKPIEIPEKKLTIPEEFDFISNALCLSLSFKNDGDNLFSYSGFRLLALEELSEYICDVIKNADELIADENDESEKPEFIKNEIIAQFVVNSQTNSKYFINSFMLIKDIIENENKINVPLKIDGIKNIIEFLDSLNANS